jgi:hypothetical protein
MKALFISLLILANGLSHSFAQVEKISYRNWENCYRLKNEKCEVIINASAGGKVIWFALNGKNVIYENPQQDGKLLADWKTKPFDPDGGRFDFGPEKVTQPLHALTWLGAWKAEVVNKNTIRLTSEPDKILGLQTTREFSLHPDSSKLTIKLSATNISEIKLVRHFWSRTLVKPGGELFLPLTYKTTVDKGWKRFLWNPDRMDSIPQPDERMKIESGKLMFQAVGSTIKAGTYAMDGWMAYKTDGLIFRKTFPTNPSGDYSGSEHLTTIFYSNGKFIELEPCSPTYSINPGQTMWFTEKWELKEDLP